MRADDIRSLVIEATERALIEAMKVRSRGGPEIEADVMAYEKALEAVAEFWKNASPTFVHAWFDVTAEGASG